jgi:hypothetical protein
MTSACTASARTRSGWPAPVARLIAEDTPPPMAPAEHICISITKGNTRAMAASAVFPSTPT